jgi:hypothetical protein
MKVKKYIVEAGFSWGWRQSGNEKADGKYTKESAQRRARHQERKSVVGLKYRIQEAK